MSLAEQGGWRAGCELLAARCFYFAPSPMLLLDQDSVVVEVNAALRVLAEMDVAGVKGWNFDSLRNTSGSKSKDGLLSPEGILRRAVWPEDTRVKERVDSEIGVTERTCQYQSRSFGMADLHAVEVPAIDRDGQHVGCTINIEIVDLEKLDSYRQALRRRWGHELMWELYAVSYDNVLREMPFYRLAVGRHLSAMNPRSGAKILDIGAGTGNVAVELLYQGCEVTAVDTSRPMLQRLRDNVRERVNAEHAGKLKIIEDSAEDLSRLEEDGQFDGVNVLLAFFDMHDPMSAFEEAVRLLRAGGALAITEPRKCFDMDNLVAHGKECLVQRGVFDDLWADWRRITTVAPQLDASIRGAHSRGSCTYSWNAEVIYEMLRDMEFLDLIIQDSHNGNCATIQGTKPD